MLTLFSIPIAFQGHAGTAQWNALQSWKRLHPEIEVILFGDEPGTREVCQQLGLRHEGKIALSPAGVPLLNEVFGRVNRVASHRLLCYANGDMILTADLVKAVKHLGSHARFFLTGRRHDLLITDRLNFEDPAWESCLRARGAYLHPAKGIDYCVYPRETLGEIPPFIIGRNYWDTWLLYRARQLRMPVVDATEQVLAIHQSHDLAGRGRTRQEIAWNRKLAGAGVYFNIDDATYELTDAGIRRKPRSGRAIVRFFDSELLIHWPCFYSVLSLAEFRRARSFRQVLLLPWRGMRKFGRYLQPALK
jgi:hypothetical protein